MDNTKIVNMDNTNADNYDRTIEYEMADFKSILKKKHSTEEVKYSTEEVEYSTEEVEQMLLAYDFASKAHEGQFRKSGEPYIIHPIAVARIVVEELQLDANSVIAAFLHDVVEDTVKTFDEIESEFGTDVKNIVKVLTKEEKKAVPRGRSSQIENFRQMLDSLKDDIRPLLIKLSDRLHNMRTLSSMRAEKQMKIAGETDFFYAPLANRLGLYGIKTELENLSLKFRCPQEYESIESALIKDKEVNEKHYEAISSKIKKILSDNSEKAKVMVKSRLPYSIWRKLSKSGKDINHIDNRSVIRIIYPDDTSRSDKAICLNIYSMLTNEFKEKPNSFINYIDSPKENGYKALHIKILVDGGAWEEVHILSESMQRNAQRGCLTINRGDPIFNWIEKFKVTLHDFANKHNDAIFMDSVMSSLYKNDILVYTPQGDSVTLPFGSTVLDFAFEIGTELGLHAHYARINGRLKSIKSVLNRGDCVEVISDPNISPKDDWSNHALSYKARQQIQEYISNTKRLEYHRCSECQPLPGDEVVGFKKEEDGSIMLHKRNCASATRLASQLGDSIVGVSFEEDSDFLYPATILIKAVDRYHLLIEVVNCITDKLNLSIDRVESVTKDAIVHSEIDFLVHSAEELRMVIVHINEIEGVDEVRQSVNN